jgi:uncharacterized protein YecT (DUF1311 family)
MNAVLVLVLALVTSGCAYRSAAPHDSFCEAGAAREAALNRGDAGSPQRGLDTCPNQSTAGLSRCASERYQQAVTEMAAVLDEVIDRVTGQYLQILNSDDEHAEAEKRRLRQAQEAWSAFREANCETMLESGFDPEGTMHSVGVWECMTSMTRKRTEELREYLRRMPIPPFPESQHAS